MTEVLRGAIRAEVLDPLTSSGWEVSGDQSALKKTFQFDSFVQAFGWMTQIAIWCEKWDHHPEWRNVYSRVEIELTTHDAGGVTELDAKLARKMDALAASGA
ncbi:4a-hydroxytetrahydrobiopterin dehydratase [Shimia sp.]|uniref:4a-hydroxytetrahydrobiopterin dehydratase n=1 Tax=Shimia sp. TaxID=1954381 RepID=UPI003B8E3B52